MKIETIQQAEKNETISQDETANRGILATLGNVLMDSTEQDTPITQIEPIKPDIQATKDNTALYIFGGIASIVLLSALYISINKK